MAFEDPEHAGIAASLQRLQLQTRRHFISNCATGLGAMYLSTVAPPSYANRSPSVDVEGIPQLDFSRDPRAPLMPLPPQFPGRARRVIYLHMVGAPSQLELFDYKPELIKRDGQDCPQSFLAGKKFAFISGVPKLLGSLYPFTKVGESGTWISDRLPYLAQHVDDLCFIHSMHTDQFNHAPAQLLLHTGQARFGYASMGSWITYGLGTENQNLPGYIVLISGSKPDGGKQLWSAGFLPSVYQGVECRSHGDPVLDLRSPAGMNRSLRRYVLDTLGDVDRDEYSRFGDPETVTRIAQYEMAFRMQLQASDALDIHRESSQIRARYGVDLGKASFANNCLVARRLAERGVRFIQLFDRGWDSHGVGKGDALNMGFKDKCKQIDQPISALLSDLKDRGLLQDTLILWGGEFGRTPMRETRQTPIFAGRDHHPEAFTIWMAGAGVKPGFSFGSTDELGYEIVDSPVEIRDLHATILYLLGFDYRRLNYPYQGLDQKLTGVKPAKIVAQLLA